MTALLLLQQELRTPAWHAFEFQQLSRVLRPILNDHLYTVQKYVTFSPVTLATTAAAVAQLPAGSS
jgi:phage tail sheath protein FI